MHLPKSAVLPSFVLVLMGIMDYITTIAGVQSAAGVELNPMMVGLVNSNISAFFAIKMAATIGMGVTLIAASTIVNGCFDRSTRYFAMFDRVLKITYLGLIAFIGSVVLNNLLVFFT